MCGIAGILNPPSQPLDGGILRAMTRSLTHRGLSLFVVPKPHGAGHGFEFVQEAVDGAPGGGKMEGRPIDTIGSMERCLKPSTSLR